MTARVVRIPWREVRLLLYRQRRPLGFALLLVLVSRVAGLGLPTASKFVVDEVIGRQQTDLLVPIAVLTCVAVAVEAAAAFGSSHLAGIAGQRTVAALRRELQARAVGLPLARIDDLGSGTLAARVTADAEQVRFLVGSGLIHLVASLLAATLALGVLLYLHVSLALGIVAVLLLFALGTARCLQRLARVYETISRRQAELTSWLGQRLEGVRIIKACRAERREAHRLAQTSHELARDGVVALRELALLSAGNAGVAGVVGGLVLAVGGSAVAAGSMSLGGLVMYIWLAALVVMPVGHFTAVTGEIGRAAAALGRIREMRRLSTEQEEDRAAAPAVPGNGGIQFEDVSFGYSEGRYVLRDISLRAPAGSTTVLVGPNGSGKSTLCRLLLAYDRPSSGRILIDGRDLCALRRTDYRSQLGAVLQDDLIFDGTIESNIRYGRPRASAEEVRAAGKLAHCEDFVARLPQGYATPVGERGTRLSAGQRRRVAIARAFLMDPRILVLDEPTSSLDAESEMLVEEALEGLRRGRTTLIVAHRLSTARGADQILFLQQGVILERGTHEALIALRGRYWALCEGQRHAGWDRRQPSRSSSSRQADRAVEIAGGNGHAR